MAESVGSLLEPAQHLQHRAARIVREAVVGKELDEAIGAGERVGGAPRMQGCERLHLQRLVVVGAKRERRLGALDGRGESAARERLHRLDHDRLEPRIRRG